MYRSKHIVSRLQESRIICWSIVGHFPVIMHLKTTVSTYHWWWSIVDFYFATCSLPIVDLILVEFELWFSLFAFSSLIIICHCLHSQNRVLAWSIIYANKMQILLICYTMTQKIHLCFHLYYKMSFGRANERMDGRFLSSGVACAKYHGAQANRPGTRTQSVSRADRP